MDDKKKCKISAGCKTHWRELLGLILVVLASFLTLISLSGAGIFGMFLVGLVLVCHKHFWPMVCGAGCGCGCPCCDPIEDIVSDLVEKDSEGSAKKAKAKKAD